MDDKFIIVRSVSGTHGVQKRMLTWGVRGKERALQLDKSREGMFGEEPDVPGESSPCRRV